MYGSACAAPVAKRLQKSLTHFSEQVLKQLRGTSFCPLARFDLIHNDLGSLTVNVKPAEILGGVFN